MAEMEMGISLNNEWAHGTHINQTQKFETTVTPQLDASLTKDTQLTAIARLRHDTKNHINVDEHNHSELRELYVETKFGSTFVTLGKQQIVWGKADGLKVLDVVNSQDWREFILDEFNESRIALWSVNVEVPISDLNLQLLWLPDQSYHNFANNGDAFQLTTPTRVPLTPTGVTVDLQDEVTPDKTIQNTDWGMRLSSFWNGWDLSLNYFYHYHDTPVLYRQLNITSNGPLITITPRYERSHLVGGSLSTTFGDITLRGELGYSTDRYISTNEMADSDGVINTNEIAYVVGLDWFGMVDTFISGQLFQSYLTNHQTGVIRKQTETTLTLLIKHDYLNETLSTEVLMLHSLDLNDGLARPKLTYQLNDEVSLSLGADIFYGDKQGLFGQFNKQDRVVSTIEIAI